MKKYKAIIIILNLIILLGFINSSAFNNEKIFKSGKLIYVELVRNSLNKPFVQADVVNLKYLIASGLQFDSLYKHGYIVVALDSNAVASRIRIQPFQLPKAANEILIAYTKSPNAIRIGAEQYSIQQDKALQFGRAKYGALKVDASGKTLLIGLYDSTFKKIE